MTRARLTRSRTRCSIGSARCRMPSAPSTTFRWDHRSSSRRQSRSSESQAGFPLVPDAAPSGRGGGAPPRERRAHGNEPLANFQPRPLDTILSHWREAQLRLEVAQLGSPEAHERPMTSNGCARSIRPVRRTARVARDLHLRCSDESRLTTARVHQPSLGVPGASRSQSVSGSSPASCRPSPLPPDDRSLPVP